MSTFESALKSALGVFGELGRHEEQVKQAACWCVETIRAGGKILICGNGGSACDAQHLAGELVGRYIHDRVPLPAIALNSDGSVLSCIGNDYCFEEVYARQVRGLARPGDLLIVFTTSGRSPNILEALRAATAAGLRSVAFLGKDGGAAAGMASLPMIVAHRETARIQEAHQFLLHCLMDQIEADLGVGKVSDDAV